MNPHDILKQAGELIGERGADYGGIEQNFERIAAIASAATGITITPHQACMVLVATKLSRMAGSRDKADNYLDAINYLAFAHELRGEKQNGSIHQSLRTISNPQACHSSLQRVGQADEIPAELA